MKFPQLFSARLLGVIFLILGIGWIWFSAIPTNTGNTNRVSAPQAGFSAPDFTLKTLNGENITLSSLQGQVVLINIWASWCPPCKAEMPTLEKVYQSYKNKGLVVLAVDSTVQDKLADAQAFVRENNLSFPILLDENGLATRLYRIESLPTSFFIGKDGVVREVVVGGPMAEALLISKVEKLLSEVH